ncbi:MAG: DUF488 family protein [Burkholderiales bacterium]
MIQVKRIYEPAADADGVRVLVDRFWPQGITRFDAHVAHWLKDVAPSTELRRWFGRRPERWTEFRHRYRAELAENTALGELRNLSKGRLVTLLHGANGIEYNHALILAAVLGRKHAPRSEKIPTKADAVDVSSPVRFAWQPDDTFMANGAASQKSSRPRPK